MVAVSELGPPPALGGTDPASTGQVFQGRNQEVDLAARDHLLETGFDLASDHAGLLGRKPAVWKSGAHDRPFYDALWATLRAGRTWEGRFTNRRKDGQLFLEDASISPVVDRREGRLIGFVAVKRDVTRQVQLEVLEVRAGARPQRCQDGDQARQERDTHVPPQ